MRRQKILITGASGRLGSALAMGLCKKNEIVQLDVRAPADPQQEKAGRFVVGSILEPATVIEAMDGVDAVIHAAAIPSDVWPPDPVVTTNVVGTFNLLEAAGQSARVKQFIFISSIRWHGLFDGYLSDTYPLYLPIDERHPSFAVSPYACSKVQGEQWCQAYVKRFRKPALAIRPSWIVDLKRESEFAAYAPPDRPHLLEYVGASDVVRGAALALNYEPKNGFEVFLFNAVDQYSTVPSAELAKRHFPNVPADQTKLAAYDGFGAFVDCTHAREALGWLPAFRCKR